MLTAYFRSPASLEYYRSGIAGRFIMNGGCGRRCASLRLRPIPTFHNDGLPIGTANRHKSCVIRWEGPRMRHSAWSGLRKRSFVHRLRAGRQL